MSRLQEWTINLHISYKYLFYIIAPNTVESFLFVQSNVLGLFTFFAGSWGRNHWGHWFCIVAFVNSSSGRKFVGYGNPQNPRTLIPHEQ